MTEEDREESPTTEEPQEEEPIEALEEESSEDNLDEILAEEDTGEVAEAEESPELVAEEEEAKPSKKKKKEAEDIVEERTYTIPLGKALIRPPKKRAPRALSIIRAFITKHMKLTRGFEEDEMRELPTLVIRNEVNEKVWSRGIEKPPRRIRVRATKDQHGNVTVYLAE